MRELTLLHTSDVHLDDRVDETRPSTGQLGFMSVIDKALELDVDMLLLAGDLFDHNRVKEACLGFASEQLARLSCPVVMITGNHDCLASYSIYHKYDPCEAGSHIHFIRDLDGTTLDFPDLGLRVWGKSMFDHHPENKPLAGLPAERRDDFWMLGMAHGYLVDRGATMFSSLITPEEIAASGLDYLAMGHVHVYQSVVHGDTCAAYCGSPNLEQGAREMTAAHITLDPATGVTVAPIYLDINPDKTVVEPGHASVGLY